MLKRKIKFVILHCSQTPDTLQGDRYGLKQINEWHKENGWIDKASGISCGYHYIVRRSGLIELGRPETSSGSHCLGHNHDSIGICHISTSRLTEMQIKALLTLCATLHRRLNIPLENFKAHYELNRSKTCPGHDMNVWRETLKLHTILD